MTEQIQDPNYTHLIVKLMCGTMIEITQPEQGMNFTITATPKPGIQVGDFADLKDGKLNIRLTTESLIGLYQTLQMIVDSKASTRKPKSWLRKILEA